MSTEIDFFCEYLCHTSSILWEILITLLIPQTPFNVIFGDSCLNEAGGYSILLGFWWHLDFPQEIKDHMLLHKNG